MPDISVLLVEDSEADAELLLLHLREAGFGVRDARVDNEADLRRKLVASDWDLVVSDFALPGFNGLQALHVVQERDSELPLIVVSGFLREDTAIEVLKAGASDFVSKDNLQRFPIAVERALRQASERRARNLAEAAVKRSDERLRAVVLSMGDMVFTADESLTIRDVFGSRGSLSGLPAERVLGLKPREIWSDQRVAMQHEAAMRRALDGESSILEWSWQVAEGTRYFQTSFAELKSEAGHSIGVVATEREITLQRNTQGELAAADRLASVGLLAAGVAHEINNPLSAIVTNVELALAELLQLSGNNLAADGNNGSVSVGRTLSDRSPPRQPSAPNLSPADLAGAAPDSAVTRATSRASCVVPMEVAITRIRAELEDIREAASRIRSVVRDVSMLSRPESEEKVLIDVQKVLDSSLRVTANQTRHAARVVRDFQPVPRIFANEARLGQLFLNLIVNATQAIPEGSASAHEIRVSTALDARGHVVVEVADTGSGMSEEVSRRIFTPFFTTKPVGHGTGLGLAICHRIVSSLNGEISVRSRPGKGTVFRVVLPPGNDEPAFLPEEPPTRALTTPPTQGAPRGAVLVLDDDDMVLTMLERALASEHDVRTTSQATQALAWLAEGRNYDVIFCDIMMPEMNGMEFFERVSQQAPQYADRIVFLTGGAFTSEAQAFLDAARNECVDKPFDIAALRGLIRRRVEANHGRPQ